MFQQMLRQCFQAQGTLVQRHSAQRGTADFPGMAQHFPEFHPVTRDAANEVTINCIDDLNAIPPTTEPLSHYITLYIHINSSMINSPGTDLNPSPEN